MVGKDAIWRMVAARTVSAVCSRTWTRSMHILVDRRSVKKVAIRSLDSSLELVVAHHHAGLFEPDLQISHVNSLSSPGLQLADHVAGSVFQYLERGDRTYLGLVENRIASANLESL